MSELQWVNIDDIQTNKDNPRKIKKADLIKLAKSITDFPEMLQVRPIVVDENMVILGGNMRFKAAKLAGLTKVPILISKLDEERKKEFIIKDNIGYGEWDMNILLDVTKEDAFSKDKLIEWGLDIKDKNENIEGQIIMNETLDYASNYLVLKFKTDVDWTQAQTLFDLKQGYNLGGNGKPFTFGLGRVIDGVEAIQKIKETYNEG